MTVVSTVDRTDYIGSGIAGPYAYTFRIFTATDLAVIQADLDGNETVLAYPADYSMSGVGNRSGGSVTLTDVLPSGYRLSLQRAVALTQPISFRNQGPYFAENVEDAFDRLTMIVQQQQDQIARAFTVPATVPIGGSTIENFVSRAYIRVNVDGDGLEGVTATVTTVQPLTPGSYLTGGVFDGSQAKTFAVDATSAATASKIVARDDSGNFAANVITAALNGNAATATLADAATVATLATLASASTKLATARAILGFSFDGTADAGPSTSSTGSVLIFDGTHWVGSHSSGVTALLDALTVAGAITTASLSSSGDITVGDGAKVRLSNTTTTTQKWYTAIGPTDGRWYLQDETGATTRLAFYPSSGIFYINGLLDINGTTSPLNIGNAGGTNRIDFSASTGFFFLNTSDAGAPIHTGGITATGTIASHDIAPTADNAYEIGTGSFRYTAVYAVNGTIQTSLAEAKDRTEFQPDNDAILHAIRGADIAAYTYKGDKGWNAQEQREHGHAPKLHQHFGVMHGSLPGWMQATDEGLSPMSVAALAMAGVRIHDVRMEELQARVSVLEKRLAA